MSATVQSLQPLILAIESSGDFGGAALMRGTEILAEATVSTARSHGAQLVPCIKRVAHAGNGGFSGIALVVVNAGPGSYTGLRIGQAAAEALGFALGVPVLGVPGLEVMCEAWLRLHPQAQGTLLPALDARRDTLVTAAFSAQGATLVRLGPDTLMAPRDLATLCASGTVFGDAARIYAGQIPSAFSLDQQPLPLPASAAGFAALRKYGEGLAACSRTEGCSRIAISDFRPVSALTIAEREQESVRRRSQYGKASKSP